MKAVNLKHIRKASKSSQEKVSRDLDIPISTYRAWEQLVNTPRSNDLSKLADYFGVTVDDLLGRTLPKDAKLPVVAETVMVPLYGSIAAGDAIEMLEVRDYFPVVKDIASKYPDGFLLQVKGESMNRVLPNMAYAYIDPTESVISGKVYAVNINGYDATIKRVRQLNNGFELIPDSTDPTFESKVYDFGNPDTEHVRIIGRVVYYVLPLDFEI